MTYKHNPLTKLFIGVSLITIIILFCNCKKTIFDSRHKYTGNWMFYSVHKFFSSANIYSNTCTFSGKISFGDAEDEIKISFRNNNDATVMVDKDGILSKMNQMNPMGEFSNNNRKVNFNLLFTTPGTHNEYYVSGTKF